MLFRPVLLLFLLLCFTFLGAQSSLRLLDKDTGEGVAFATVGIAEKGLQLLSDQNGRVPAEELLGAGRIRIYCLGYQSVSITYADLVAQDFTIYLQAVSILLEQIVVGAVRWRQSSAKQAATTIRIDQQAVALLQPQTAADLLGISGKVYIQKSQQGGGSPLMRGFASNRLLYAVDGVRMNTAIFRSGNLQNVINLDPFVMENTEVIFGPSSVIYGSDAIGGVMSFQTLAPSFSSSDEMQLQGKAVLRHATANQEKTGHFDLNIGGKKWASLSSISHWDYDHLRQGKHGPSDYLKPVYVRRIQGQDSVLQQSDPLLQIPSAYSQLNLMQKFRFQPNKFWDFSYSFHYSATSPYGRYDRHNRLRSGLPRYGTWDYGPQKWQMQLLQISHQSAHQLYDELAIRLAQQAFEESRRSRHLFSDERSDNLEAVLAYSLNIDFRKRFPAGQNLYYGLEYLRNEVNSEGWVTALATNIRQAGAARYPQADWSSAAAYLNADWAIRPKTLLSGGLRYNYYGLAADFSNNNDFFPLPFQSSELENAAFTGSLGLVHRPNDQWIIRSQVATAFRSPNVDDIGKIFDSEPSAVTVPNPDLAAEYAYNLDFGFAYLVGEKAKIDLSGYYTLLKNALVRRNYQLNGQDSLVYEGILSQVQAIQNAAEARVYGLQMGLEWQISPSLQFSGDLNWQAGREELDNGSQSPARHAAPFFGTLRLQYRRGKIRGQLYSNFQGQRSHEQLAVEERSKDEIYAKDAEGRNYAPAWHTLNFKAAYHFSPAIQLAAGLENISDQRYRPYSSGISGAGINGVLSLQLSF